MKGPFAGRKLSSWSSSTYILRRHRSSCPLDVAQCRCFEPVTLKSGDTIETTVTITIN